MKREQISMGSHLKMVGRKRISTEYIIGIDEVRRAAKRRASPKAKYIIGIDEVGRAASKRRASPLTKFIIGIDEVGRGPLAGPVMVAAVLLNKKLNIKDKRWLRGIRDSKQLTARQREEWVRTIKKLKIPYAVARVSPTVIDRMNISRAANLAALRAFMSLSTRYALHPTRCSIFLDGGLYLGNERARTGSRTGTNLIRVNPRSNLRISATTVVRGDEKIPAVALASIVAKVARDKYMGRLARKYTGYGLEQHMGYGTKAHLAALRKLGPSPIHRLTFIHR